MKDVDKDTNDRTLEVDELEDIMLIHAGSSKWQ